MGCRRPSAHDTDDDDDLIAIEEARQRGWVIGEGMKRWGKQGIFVGASDRFGRGRGELFGDNVNSPAIRQAK